MKTLYTQFFLLVSALSLTADQFFAGVDVNDSGWEVIFPFKGLRYQVKIGDQQRGTSGYGQRLLLNNGEELTLTEKHLTLVVTRRKQGRPLGVKIEITSHDRKTGKEEFEVIFESVHNQISSLNQEIEDAVDVLDVAEQSFYKEAKQAALRNEEFQRWIRSYDPIWAAAPGQEWGEGMVKALVELSDENKRLTKELKDRPKAPGK